MVCLVVFGKQQFGKQHHFHSPADFLSAPPRDPTLIPTTPATTAGRASEPEPGNHKPPQTNRVFSPYEIQNCKQHLEITIKPQQTLNG
jgi:hypothetical protein